MDRSEYRRQRTLTTTQAMSSLQEDVRNAAIQAGVASGSVLDLRPRLASGRHQRQLADAYRSGEVNGDDIQ